MKEPSLEKNLHQEMKVNWKIKGKKINPTSQGFYFAWNEPKERDKIFIFYAFDYETKQEIVAYIPKSLVLKELEESENERC
jgi:hypothetical protein